MLSCTWRCPVIWGGERGVGGASGGGVCTCRPSWVEEVPIAWSTHTSCGSALRRLSRPVWWRCSQVGEAMCCGRRACAHWCVCGGVDLGRPERACACCESALRGAVSCGRRMLVRAVEKPLRSGPHPSLAVCAQARQAGCVRSVDSSDVADCLGRLMRPWHPTGPGWYTPLTPNHAMYGDCYIPDGGPFSSCRACEHSAG